MVITLSWWCCSCLPPQQAWIQRESTGSAETRRRWRACSGSLNKVTPLFQLLLFFHQYLLVLAFWNLSAKNQNHLGNRDSPITKQEAAAECVGPISSDQLCSSHPPFPNFREVLVMFMHFFRGTCLTLTYLWPVTLSCCSNMLTRASAGHCKGKATSVCMLGCIYNKSGST